MESANFNRAYQLFQNGRYDLAIEKFNQALQDHPDDFETKFYLAMCHYNLSDYKKAWLLSESIFNDDPNDPDIHHLRGLIKLQLNEVKEALTMFDEAIRITPNRAEFFAAKASGLFRQKKFQEALDLVNHALSLNPRHTGSLNLRAQLLTKLNKTEEAEETVAHILYDNPEDSDSHANIGWVALENRDHKKALTHFKNALQFDPNNTYAQQGMSTALKAKNLLYRTYLKYEFWMGNKSEKNQWAFVIGIYVAYRLVTRFLGEIGLEILVLPLVVAYLLFALSGWIMESLSNSILNFDRYGKYLLQKEERYNGYTFTILLGVGLISLVLFYGLDISYFMPVGVSALCSLIVLPRAFLLHRKKSKNLAFLYGSVMIFIGVVGPLVYQPVTAISFAVFMMMIVYTWIGNLGN